MNKKLPVLLFDVNETLLSLEEIRTSIAEILNGKDSASLWLETMLHYSLVATVSGQYYNFGEIGAEALRMVAGNREIKMSREEAKNILSPIHTAPPHHEVPAALERLAQEGFRMAVLTNSARDVMNKQLDNAGIDSYFEQCLSIEELRLYKPHRKPYLWAAEQMKTAPQNCLFIAAHGWDVAGAMAVGMEAAFLARPGQALYSLAPRPAIIANDLDNLHHRLTE